jgi:hypothetical protein
MCKLPTIERFMAENSRTDVKQGGDYIRLLTLVDRNPRMRTYIAHHAKNVVIRVITYSILKYISLERIAKLLFLHRGLEFAEGGAGQNAIKKYTNGGSATDFVKLLVTDYYSMAIAEVLKGNIVLSPDHKVTGNHLYVDYLQGKPAQVLENLKGFNYEYRATDDINKKFPFVMYHITGATTDRQVLLWIDKEQHKYLIEETKYRTYPKLRKIWTL